MIFLYICDHSSATILLLVYIDNIIVCNIDTFLLEGLVWHLSSVFAMKDLS